MIKRILLPLLFIFVGLCFSTVFAQDETLEPITSENASDLRFLSRLGYGSITDIAFSPNGEYFAIGTGVGIALYDMDDLTAEPRFWEGGTRTITFSPDSTMLASDGRLWDVRTGDVLHEIQGTSPVFSPDGSQVYTAYSQEIVIIDIDSGEERGRQSIGHEIQSLIINADGVTLGIETNDGLLLWNLEMSSESVSLEGTQYILFGSDSAFSPNGNLFLEAGWDGFVAWDVATGTAELEVYSWQNPALQAVAFSPDGEYFVIGDANAGVNLYENLTGEYVHRFRHNDEILSVDFSPDGTTLAAAAINGVIKLWNLETGTELTALRGYGNAASVVGFNDRDTALTIASIGGAASQWDLITRKQINVAQGYIVGATHGTLPFPNTIDINSRATLLATGNAVDGRVYLWTPNGESRGNLEIGFQDVVDIAFSSHTSLIAVLGRTNVYLWELESGSRVRGLRIRDRFATNVAVSPDGSVVAVGDQAGMTTIQDRVTARVIAELQGGEGDVTNLKFSSDGSMVAFTNYCYRCSSTEEGDYGVWLLSVESGDLLHRLEGHTSFIKGLTFSPDGSILASVSGDGTLRLWSSSSGEELATIEEQAVAIAFNHAGTMLASSSVDGAIRLWGIPDRQDG